MKPPECFQHFVLSEQRRCAIRGGTHWSHVTHDFGSIAHFTEEVFNLPSLGFADSPADDMFDCFQFNHEPHEFRPDSGAVRCALLSDP